jgi:hypothetical protein
MDALVSRRAGRRMVSQRPRCRCWRRRPRAPGCDASGAAAGHLSVVARPLCSVGTGLAGDVVGASVSSRCVCGVHVARLVAQCRRSRLTLPISGGGRRGQEEPRQGRASASCEAVLLTPTDAGASRSRMSRGGVRMRHGLTRRPSESKVGRVGSDDDVSVEKRRKAFQDDVRRSKSSPRPKSRSNTVD